MDFRDNFKRRNEISSYSVTNKLSECKVNECSKMTTQT